MKHFTRNEAVIISVTYAVMGAILLWAIMLMSGCTYVDVYTDDVTITGNVGR